MAKSSIIGKGPLSVTLPSGGGVETPEQIRDKLASLTGSNKLEAASTHYDGASSGMLADDTQDAIDEVDGRLDELEGDLDGKIYTTYQYTLTTFDISTRSVTLPDTPNDPELTSLEVEGAGSLSYGDSYTVSGNTLSWAGLGLDGILEIGDKIKVIYN